MGKTAIIIGAGPAGLTAGYELVRHTAMSAIVLEATGDIGGISQTARHNGNYIDIGGHRFFSKSRRVEQWWLGILPLQGAMSKDDILIGRNRMELYPSGPDPESCDKVMLIRERVSRIYWLRHFFDYPISLKWSTLRGLGLVRTAKVGASYLCSRIRPLPETSLENFYINRFGRYLYKMFFEGYTEKVWGKHPSQLAADWGSQRVKGVSLTAVLKNMLGLSKGHVETSLIESFIYPKHGPGQLWETVATDIVRHNGQVRLESKVTGINISGRQVMSVDYEDADGNTHNQPLDYLLSTMPLRDLVRALRGIDVPDDIRRIAEGLPYRDFLTVGVLAKKLLVRNETPIRTYGDRIPDTWIYVQDREVKVGRLQIFNNWSPYMVKDYTGTVWIGMEYFCNEGDELWSKSKAEMAALATEELVKIGMTASEDVLDTCVIKVKKAYPAYYGTYSEFHKLKTFLDTIPNLYCLGRNGQHRYNNMDHSMLTAMICVDNIRSGITDKENIWSVNTEIEYHETKCE